MAKKFPNVIYVTTDGEGDGRYFEVAQDGVETLEEHGQAVAVYQLVEVGEVTISKQFVSKSKKRR